MPAWVKVRAAAGFARTLRGAAPESLWPERSRRKAPTARGRQRAAGASSHSPIQICLVTLGRSPVLSRDARNRRDGPERMIGSNAVTGGEAGIRTLGTTLRSYNGLANR